MNKVETLKRYKFSLAFENSNEEDYVTEKFFQSLVAGVLFRLLFAMLTIQLLFVAAMHYLFYVSLRCIERALHPRLFFAEDLKTC